MNTCKNSVFTAVLIGALASTSVLASTKTAASGERVVSGRYLEYLYGIVVLTAAPQQSSALRAQRYAELQRITGVSAAQFKTWVASFKNKPQQWEKTQAALIQLLDKEEQAWQANMSANSPTRILKPKP